MANTSLTRTFDQVGNRTTWTLSVWIKRTGIGGQQNFFGSFPQSTDYERIMFNNDKIYIAEVAGGSTNWECETDAVYRDVTSWYHLVLRHDTTQSTANDRIRLYINGVQQTFGTNSQPAQNRGTAINTADVHKIGMGNSSEYTDCIMSHFHWCDGQSYAPTVFGSTDATTGEWKINTSPTVTYGNQGWFMFKDDASLNDDSGNSNNWSADSGTIQKSEDCPSNVFATYNAIQNLNDNNALSNGNTTQKETSTVGQRQAICNIGGFTGKYYAEFKMINLGPQNGSSPYCGALSMSNYDNDTYLGNNGIAMHPGGNIYRSANVIDNQTSITYTTNSIVSVALDITNNKCHFRVNGGTWLASGDPANNTGGYDISSLNTGDGMTFASSVFNNNCQWNVNFGNGYFGTTAVSSAGTNASNNGIFEYDVPTGFTALSTKGLNL